MFNISNSIIFPNKTKFKKNVKMRMRKKEQNTITLEGSIE